MMGRLNRDQGQLFYSFCLEVSAPTLFSPKSNGANVDNQRKADRWG
jgi:hypothetical protein